jgi:predicted ATPase
MDRLGEAIDDLREGKGRILSICGDAGTGKSRLVEEFKASLDLEEIQWLYSRLRHVIDTSRSLALSTICGCHCQCTKLPY